MLKEKSVHGCRRAKYKTYCLFDDLLVVLSTSKTFDYFRSQGDEITWPPNPNGFVNEITVKDGTRDSLCYIFLEWNCTKF